MRRWTLIPAGLVLLMSAGCGPKDDGKVAGNDAEALKADPSQMPPEARARMEAAQQAGGSAAEKAEETK